MIGSGQSVDWASKMWNDVARLSHSWHDVTSWMPDHWKETMAALVALSLSFAVTSNDQKVNI
jgi:hypothetical protein